MKNILLLSFLFVYISCDAPLRSRNPYASPIDTSKLGGTPTPTPTPDGTNKAGTDNANKDSETTTETTTTPGFETCQLGPIHNINSGGNFGVCQSTLNEKQFKAKFVNSDSSNGTCFVPLHVNSDGSSYYLGPPECVHHTTNKEYTFLLTKQRSEIINGLMIIKNNALNPYMQCMTAKMQFMSQYNNCQTNNAQTNAQCVQAAESWAYGICNNFATLYSGDYLQLSL